MLTYADVKVVVPQANAPPKRWELQIKGAGKTAYSRSGDGRKLLRSSYTPLTRLLHASCTPLTAYSRSGDGRKLLRSSSTPLPRLLHAFYMPRTCSVDGRKLLISLHASYTPLTRPEAPQVVNRVCAGRDRVCASSCVREFLACEAMHYLRYTPYTPEMQLLHAWPQVVRRVRYTSYT